MSDNTRTDQSPSDPQYGWRGQDTDLRNRPSPNQLDELRRNQRPRIEKAVANPRNETAALAYDAGISEKLAARIIALEKAMENPLLLQTVTELANGYGELTVQIAELRQAIAALQAKKKS
jgi:hypothetical protein